MSVCITCMQMPAQHVRECEQSRGNKSEKAGMEETRWWLMWTDADGIVDSFLVGNKKHSQNKNIYAKARRAFPQSAGGSAYRTFAFAVTGHIRVINLFYGHSAMPAIGCALINIPKGTSLHVQILRVCNGFHSATPSSTFFWRQRSTIFDSVMGFIFYRKKCACGHYWCWYCNHFSHCPLLEMLMLEW